MPRKTLHNVRPPVNPPEGSIPHVFHKHGKVNTHEDYLDLPDGNDLPTETDSQKMTAYGVIAAGNSIVPWKNVAAGPMLQYALRTAISTRLMTDVGGHEKPPVFPASEIGPDDYSVYQQATTAMAHWGSANQSAVLKKAQKWIKEYGLPSQAKLLPKLIEAAVEMGLDHDYGGLGWFYKEFHALYGKENKPNPDCPPETPLSPPSALPPWQMEMLPADFFKDGGGGLPSGKDKGPQWGKIQSISKCAMIPWKHPKIRSVHAWKHSEFGVFKHPWRALPSSDYRCFSVKRRKYGGTILVDMSGSMRIDQKEVDRVLDIAPSATIAGYSGKNYEVGNIVIIAEDSKKGAAEEARASLGGYNIIDGPALEWLAKQAAPRIWVSDGRVTGYGESHHPALNADCERISRAAKIYRIPSLAKLLEMIS